MNNLTVETEGTAPLNVHRELTGAVKAAEVLKQHLVDLGADDDETLRDTLDGETNLKPLMDAALVRIAMDEAALKGLKSLKETIASREARLKKRIEAFKAALHVALDVAVLPRHEAPIGTISKKAVPPKLQVVDQSAIPSKYFEAQDPKLSSKELLADLKARNAALDAFAKTNFETDDMRTAALETLQADYPEVPGAEMSNGGETVQIRWA